MQESNRTERLGDLDTKLANLLTLAELEALTGLGLTGFLTLDHTRVTHEEAFLLEGGAILDVVLAEGAGDSHTEGLGLAGDAATVEVGFDIPFAFGVSHGESLVDDVLQRTGGEILLIVAAVDLDLTVTGGHIDAGDGGLSSTNGVDYFCHILILILLR